MSERRADIPMPSVTTPQKVQAIPLSALALSWSRAFFFNPNAVGALFWAAAGAIGILALLLRPWTFGALLALAAVAGICMVACAVRMTIGRRLPPWTLHLEVAIATVLVSVAAWVGLSKGIPFADLYIWVGLFAALYFRPPAVVAHIGFTLAAYAAVLVLGSTTADPFMTWLALAGTLVIASVVVLGLVSVLRIAAMEDTLTGLANRRLWDERLEQEMERARRTGAFLSVALIDIDSFKETNDTLGHAYGDHLLQQSARAWQSEIRGSGDLLARLGGDEFGLLAPSSDEIGIRLLARRLRRALPKEITASFGVATWDRTENGRELLRRADSAMYTAKQAHHRAQIVPPTG